jgi:hypothetical protein
MELLFFEDALLFDLFRFLTYFFDLCLFGGGLLVDFA